MIGIILIIALFYKFTFLLEAKGCYLFLILTKLFTL
jgi:hypothetical protein